MPILKPIFNFFIFKKTIQLAITKGLWPHKFLSDIMILTFPENDYSIGSLALDNNIELKCFTVVAIDERTESKATKSKFKTEVEDNYPLTNCNSSY